MNSGSLKVQTYLTIITSHDFIFYTSHEYNAIGSMENVMNNYGIIYALNSIFPELDIYRTASGVKPYYRTDFQKIKTYSTPAYRINQFKKTIKQKSKTLPKIFQKEKAVIQDQIINWEESAPVGSTYNSVGELSTFKMEQIKYNFPNLGKYYKLPPLSTFICFTVGEKPPAIIRLGKKFVPCRVHSYLLNNIELNDGAFYPNHPVNLSELPPETQVLEGSLVYLQPASILINGKLEGKHIIGEFDKLKYTISIPSSSIYPKVFNFSGN